MLSADFDAMYSPIGRPSIPPEQLLRALLLQAFYTVRSERQLMEQLDYNLLFRWFTGLGIDGGRRLPPPLDHCRDRHVSHVELVLPATRAASSTSP